MRSVYIEKFRWAWNLFELKGEVLKKPQYQEKKRVQMTFHTEVNLILGLNVKWRMILAVVNSYDEPDGTSFSPDRAQIS